MKWFLLFFSLVITGSLQATPNYYAKFEHNNKHSYGQIIGKNIQPLTGDLIFMGTPGRTKELNNGDKVSVSIENVGSVENIIQTSN